MAIYLNGDIIPASPVHTDSAIHLERVWRHRHDLELGAGKPRRVRLAMLALGVGGLLLGSIGMLWYGNLGPAHTTVFEEAMASRPVRQVSKVVSTNLREVRDVASVPVSASKAEPQKDTLPYSVIPTKRPTSATIKSGGSQATGKFSTANSAKVVRYDRCQPKCETQDPLIVGTIRPVVYVPTSTGDAETIVSERTDKTRDIGAAAMNSAGMVLFQTATLPFTAVKFGRDALIKTADLD
ncbi:hypothetical protein [Agrobacterium rosae]|uniref:hypothetical protein n=1 Tax=Agrobacterium rosae TaxID=1972867 RepID=UPI00122F06CB|nr:hypothetical protein [Agrobacterium rosae]KAA3509141.1 hypothetical protein DXM21_22190 [Agrobacterium rosae]KAA3513835.1 hypothetical protein DXM25_22380 [Agrobacterium rosae]MQB50849.1 hypothetical protein [Agrobacterium rosae]